MDRDLLQYRYLSRKCNQLSLSGFDLPNFMTLPVSAQLTCYSIDDELPTHQILSKYISRLPYLQLIGQTVDPFEGLSVVESLRPNILFLDVEMPELNGLSFLKSLTKPHPAVIMITASPTHAANTYDFEDVVHYLLKPVGYDKFVEAISRVVNRLSFDPINKPQAATEAPLHSNEVRDSASFILVKKDRKLIQIALEDIVFVEGFKDYINIHLVNSVIVTRMTMGKLEESLPTTHFLRVSRSYIVRRQAISEIDGNLITMFDGKRVSIGVTYRDIVMNEFKRNIL